MEVYIEDVIIDNIVLNFLLLFLTKKLLRSERKNIFLFLGAVFGMLGAVALALKDVQGIFLFLYKFALGSIIVLISFGYKSIRSYLLTYLCFVFATALMGGLSFLISFSFGKAIVSNGEVYYELGLPIGVVWLVVGLFSALICKVVKIIRKKTLKSNYIFEARLEVGNKRLKTKIYLDTGNTLEDLGKPITLISQKQFSKLYPNVSLISLFLGNVPKDISSARYITTDSVGGKKKMLVFEVERLVVEDKKEMIIQNALLGLSQVEFEKKLDCGLVGGIELFSGEKYAS